MGRPKKSWVLREPRTDGDCWAVRFTIDGQRVERSTGERDPAKAADAAAQIYARALTAPAPRQSVVGRAIPLDALLAAYLAALTTTHDTETVHQYEAYARKFVDYFHNNFGAIHRAALADYQRKRLGEVLVRTLRKEKSFLNGFLSWCVEQGELPEDRRPTWPAVPKRALGVRVGPQRAVSVQVTPEQVRDFLSALPEWSRTRAGKAHAIRARFVVAYETGLRPATIDAISVPTHWTPGATHLQIRAEDDKARFARRVPLSPAACLALEQTWADDRRGDSALVFGAHDFREVVERARLRAGLPAGFAPYDLRHARVQHLLDRGVPVRAVMLLVGHRQMSTTNIYVKSDERAAEQAMRTDGVLGGFWGADDQQAVRRKGFEPLQELPHRNLKAANIAETPINRRVGLDKSTHKRPISDRVLGGPPKRYPWVQEATIALLSRLAGVSP